MKSCSQNYKKKSTLIFTNHQSNIYNTFLWFLNEVIVFFNTYIKSKNRHFELKVDSPFIFTLLILKTIAIALFFYSDIRKSRRIQKSSPTKLLLKKKEAVIYNSLFYFKTKTSLFQSVYLINI